MDGRAEDWVYCLVALDASINSTVRGQMTLTARQSRVGAGRDDGWLIHDSKSATEENEEPDK
jgi:predicted component of type VI protein secretion system